MLKSTDNILQKPIDNKLMRQEAKEYPSFPLGNRLYIQLGLYSRGKTFHTPSEEKEDYSACILRKAEQTLLRLLSLLLDTNLTLTYLYFSRAKDGVLVAVLYQRPRSRSRRVSDL